MHYNLVLGKKSRTFKLKLQKLKSLKAHFHFIRNSQIACDPLFEIRMRTFACEPLSQIESSQSENNFTKQRDKGDTRYQKKTDLIG